MTKSLTKEEAQTKVDEQYGVGEYTLLSEYKNNHTKLVVLHHRCGSTFERNLGHLVSGGRGCDYCYNGNSTTPEEFEARFTLNLSEKFELLSSYHRVHEKIKVRGILCGHEFEVEPNAIMRKGYGCPKCAINAKQDTSMFKEIVSLVDEGSYLLVSQYVNNTTKVSIKHLVCGNTYQATPKDFKNGNRCPICRSSKGEMLIAEVLKELDIWFEREKVFPDLKNPETKSNNSYLRFDFFVPERNVLIEYDGIQHFKSVPYFDKTSENLSRRKRRDGYKSDYARANNIMLVRVPYTMTDKEARDKITQVIVGKAEGPLPK